MPRVLITCPVTQKPLPTGVELDAVAFQLERGCRFAPCPHCQQQHRWTKATAWLEQATREEGVPRDRLVVTALRRWYAQRMPVRAALVTALITERPLCMACISERALAPVDEVRALFQRIQELLQLQCIESARCHACGLVCAVFVVKLPMHALTRHPESRPEASITTRLRRP